MLGHGRDLGCLVGAGSEGEGGSDPLVLGQARAVPGIPDPGAPSDTSTKLGEGNKPNESGLGSSGVAAPPARAGYLSPLMLLAFCKEKKTNQKTQN